MCACACGIEGKHARARGNQSGWARHWQMQGRSGALVCSCGWVVREGENDGKQPPLCKVRHLEPFYIQH